MKAARSIAEVRAALEPLRPRGDVGLVATMGALHAGHVSLLRAARAECATVAASIFVNPTQFGPDEDFATYPRDEEADLAVLGAEGVDVTFLPRADEMYPPQFETWVDVTVLSRALEGEARPGHFRGVATICLKLFNIVQPHRAYFGQKDAQQAELVKRAVRDLNVPIEIRVLPTVRDADDVALSSRNAMLSPEEREAARALPRALFAGVEAHRHGANPVAVARTILASERRLQPEYLELVQWNGRPLLVAAVRAGRTRLIDNVVLAEKEGDGR
jgi:pantoate--beta-alanine ligase